MTIHLTEISRLVNGRETGVLYLKTADNRSASVSLERGSIVGLTFRARRGPKAIALMRDADFTSFSFDPKGLAITTDGLPNTVEIISILDQPAVPVDTGPTAAAGHSPVAPAPAPAPAPARATATAAVASMAPPAQDHGQMRDILVQIMADVFQPRLGAESRRLVGQAVDQHRALQEKQAVAAAIREVSRHLPDQRETDEVLLALNKRILPLFSKHAVAEVLRGEFTEYLGPMASIICDTHLARLPAAIRSLQQVDQVIGELAGEIDDRAEQRRFLQGVSRRLSRL